MPAGFIVGVCNLGVSLGVCVGRVYSGYRCWV